jgi:hypothetical protein
MIRVKPEQYPEPVSDHDALISGAAGMARAMSEEVELEPAKPVRGVKPNGVIKGTKSGRRWHIRVGHDGALTQVARLWGEGDKP